MKKKVFSKFLYKFPRPGHGETVKAFEKRMTSFFNECKKAQSSGKYFKTAFYNGYYGSPKFFRVYWYESDKSFKVRVLKEKERLEKLEERKRKEQEVREKRKVFEMKRRMRALNEAKKRKKQEALKEEALVLAMQLLKAGKFKLEKIK